MKSQLFRRNPDRYIINDLMMVFNIKSLDDKNFHFTKDDLINLNIIDKINEIKDKLEIYYLPCKAKMYLKDLTEKKCITILRQCIKLYGYNVKSKEKYIKGDKLIIYQIINKNEPKNIKKDKEKECVISFD